MQLKRRKQTKTREATKRRGAADILQIENALGDRRSATLAAFMKALRPRGPRVPSPEAALTGRPLGELTAGLRRPAPSPLTGRSKSPGRVRGGGGRRKGAARGGARRRAVIRL